MKDKKGLRKCLQGRTDLVLLDIYQLSKLEHPVSRIHCNMKHIFYI